VSHDLVAVFLLALYATLNPSLLAATTLMLLLPNPKRLMLGYLLGAYTTSFTVGLLILFLPHTSSAENTSKHKIAPAEDILIGLICLVIAWIIETGRDRPLEKRRRKKKEAKLEAKQRAGKPTESLPTRLLRKADPKLTFVVGALVSFPGVAYLDALDHIRKLNTGNLASVLLVVFFCVCQQILLEAPLAGYIFSPGRTEYAVESAKSWLTRRGRTLVTIGAAVVAVWLLARGVATLL
jgi:hypothetical protein